MIDRPITYSEALTLGAYVPLTDKRLASGDFAGGKSGAVRILGKLGFNIQPRQPDR